MSLLVRIKRGIKGFGFFCLESMAPLLKRSAPLEVSAVKKVLVIEGGGIGDLIGVLPSIEALHKNFPRASITLLASPASSEVLKLYGASCIIDELISYEARGRHSSFGAKVPLLLSLRKRGFDLSFAPGRGEGMREVMLMSYIIGAPVRFGFTQGKAGLLNTCHLEFRGDVPILRQNLDLLRGAGLEVSEDGVDLEVPGDVLLSLYAFLEARGIKRGTSFVVIHPGAAWNASLRCWPVARYAELIGALRDELGQKIVVIGSKGERAAGEEIFREFPEDDSVVNAIGETSLLEMAGLISLSSLFIGNDSGPLHLAQALGTASVAIFGLTSPQQVIWREERSIAVQPPATAPPYLHQYDYRPAPSDAAIFDLISVEDVMAAVRRAAEAGI